MDVVVWPTCGHAVSGGAQLVEEVLDGDKKTIDQGIVATIPFLRCAIAGKFTKVNNAKII